MSSHRFKKQFGQNFLKHDRFAHKLLESAEIGPEDHVVEIGPGDGRVTNLLLNVAAKVVAIEVDYDLIVKLVKRFNEYPNFEIVNQDILQVDFESIRQEFGLSDQYKVVGSLPYNISKQIIAKMLEITPVPKQMAFILQEEVTDAYAAKPPQATFLSNWLALRAEAKKTIAISNKQFYPVPKVNGGILQVKPFALTTEDKSEVDKISRLIRIGFSSPRKTLWNNLKSNTDFDAEKLKLVWEELGLEKERPAEISLDLWKTIYSKLNTA